MYIKPSLNGCSLIFDCVSCKTISECFFLKCWETNYKKMETKSQNYGDFKVIYAPHWQFFCTVFDPFGRRKAEIYIYYISYVYFYGFFIYGLYNHVQQQQQQPTTCIL